MAVTGVSKVAPLDALGGTDAVNGGGNDASGIAGSLSAGVKVLQVNVLEGLRVAGQAHGRGGAGLHCKEQGLGEVRGRAETTDLPLRLLTKSVMRWAGARNEAETS